MQMSSKERKYVEHVIMRKHFLELGSGYSTLWFSQFATKIVSVETRKEWFIKIKYLLDQHSVQNVKIHLLEPESCAYDHLGREKWNERGNSMGSDYGTAEEFSGYLHGIGDLLCGNNFDVVLVDGNVRGLVIEYMRNRNYRGRVLLHDVMPEREYLNKPILTMEGITVVAKVDTLAELVVHSKNLRVFS
jgi:hypothetical protein